MDFGQLSWRELAAVAGVALAGAAIGTIGGHALREWVLNRPLHGLRTRRGLEAAYRKYRDPIVLAALELSSRLIQVCRDYPPDYLDSEVLDTVPRISPGADGAGSDAWIQRYTVESTVYRLCALLGWLELYRQSVAHLDIRELEISQKLDRAIFTLRADMADVPGNMHPNAEGWHDVRLLREEQRAIGEAMITEVDGQRTVLGYGEFCRLLVEPDMIGRSRWLRVAGSLLLDPKLAMDFRLMRLQRLVVHLVDLVGMLAPRRLRDIHTQARERYQDKAAADLTLTTQFVA
jgi:hypothetical protein